MRFQLIVRCPRGRISNAMQRVGNGLVRWFADPATLLPKRVLREQLLTLQIKDTPERTDVERHEYTFEWEPAAAPKASEPPK